MKPNLSTKHFKLIMEILQLLNDLIVLIQGLAQRIIITGCKENLLKVNVKDYLHPYPYLWI